MISGLPVGFKDGLRHLSSQQKHLIKPSSGQITPTDHWALSTNGFNETSGHKKNDILFICGDGVIAHISIHGILVKRKQIFLQIRFCDVK